LQEFLANLVKIFFVMLRKVDNSMFSVFEKIKELAKNQGKSLSDVEESLGYGRNTLYKIKNSTPNAERIKEIADYFHVSTDYLLGRTDNPAIADDKEKFYFQGQEVDVEELAGTAMRFNGKPLTDKDKKSIQSIIEAFLRSQEGGNG
jgi:raw score 17.76